MDSFTFWISFPPQVLVKVYLNSKESRSVKMQAEL